MNTDSKFINNKILGILTGGGDTPALNASIEAIKSRAAVLGFKVYGILHGWKGLLNKGEIVDMTNLPFDGWYGGTDLFSSRTNPFPTINNPIDRTSQVLNNLERYKIDVLVTIGGDDTNGAAKKMHEQYNIPVIGFPKTIDNDLRTRTFHNCNNEEIESVLCPGFPTAAITVSNLISQLRTNVESHSRIMVVEVMGRDAGWLTGAAKLGGAQMCLIPEIQMTKERKECFFELVKEEYYKNKRNHLIIGVAEGTRWYNELTGEVEIVCASPELDEYGHNRFGGISGIIASEISRNTGIEARAQNLGYLARSGRCSIYDKRFVNILADKVVDLLLREDYGKMPILKKLTKYQEIEEYNTASIDMGQIENRPLDLTYYDSETFRFNNKYSHYLCHMAKKPKGRYFEPEFSIINV